MARRIPNSQLIIYEDAGHGAIFQNHANFVEKALAFLDPKHPDKKLPDPH
jgi:pimeloyl-ACP methyl ester carboxylesterase